MSVEDTEEIPKHRAKKDTRRWCRGRAGVKHAPVWEFDPRFGSDGHGRIFVCQKCQKRLDYWFSLWGRLRDEPAPEIGSTKPRR